MDEQPDPKQTDEDLHPNSPFGIQLMAKKHCGGPKRSGPKTVPVKPHKRSTNLKGDSYLYYPGSLQDAKELAEIPVMVIGRPIGKGISKRPGKTKMATNLSWKLYYASLDNAAKEGERIAQCYGFVKPPVDPFAIIKQEKELIHAEGYDFKDAFDGRIKYVGPRFLICYNTRYNSWRHSGEFHSKIVFTLGHELGHFFLPKHREYLVTSKKPHGSFTEFTADPLVEKQADFFASGLLMPGFLVKPKINKKNFVSYEEFLDIRSQFQASVTGMMVRWVQLSDFPCATFAIRKGRILYGWVSKALRERGVWKIRKGDHARGRCVTAFIDADPRVRRFRKKNGSGAVFDWIHYDKVRLLTQEFYFAIPHSQTVWAMVMADENDLDTCWYE